jgi:hypothetical protein|nr:MAG TPA: hypothetical protein [Caudoviricetes sp.]
MSEQIKELSQNELERKVDYIFSHRFNHTLHAYIDIAGDLTAGVLLSQIMYWFDKDSKNECVRTKIKKKGYFWIARRRDEWANEIRVAPKQYDSAMKKLKAKKLVIVEKFKINGAPTTHIRPNDEVINVAIKEWKEQIALEIIKDNEMEQSDMNSSNQNLPEEENREKVVLNDDKHWFSPKEEFPNSQNKENYGISQNGKMELPKNGNSLINKNYNKDLDEVYKKRVKDSDTTKVVPVDSPCPGKPETRSIQSPLGMGISEILLRKGINQYWNDVGCEEYEELKTNVTNVILYFLEKYKIKLGRSHVHLKEEYIKTVVEGIVTVPDEMIELIDAYGFEYIYKSCIDMYFDINFREDTNYRIFHFIKGDIRKNIAMKLSEQIELMNDK